MKPIVFIRTDGTAAIGLGHIVRCLSLAQMIKNDCRVNFFVKKPDACVVNMIIEQGFTCNVIRKEEEFFVALKNDSVVIIDGYHFDTEFQKKIKSKARGLVCIDDLHKIHFVADIVINHALGVKKKDYFLDSKTRLLCGLDYALLRPEFLNHKNNHQKENSSIKKILICFGGSDFKNLTAKVFSWIPKRHFEITIITGLAYPYSDELTMLIANQQNVKVKWLKALSAAEMRDTFCQNDLAILPASGILLEAISIGIPLITGFYVENQLDFYREFLAIKIAIDAKDFNEKDFKQAFEKALSYDFDRMMTNQAKCIDGHSPQRIREEILSLCKKKQFVNLDLE